MTMRARALAPWIIRAKKRLCAFPFEVLVAYRRGVRPRFSTFLKASRISGALSSAIGRLPNSTQKSRCHDPCKLPRKTPRKEPDARKIRRTTTKTKMQVRSVVVEENERWWMRTDARMVPLAGIEPALLAELDFESSASTSSATGAFAGHPVGPGSRSGRTIAGGGARSTRADVIVRQLDSACPWA